MCHTDPNSKVPLESGQAPTTASKRNFYLPLTAIYRRWCAKLIRGPPRRTWPRVFQCTWTQGGEFHLGASRGGFASESGSPMGCVQLMADHERCAGECANIYWQAWSIPVNTASGLWIVSKLLVVNEKRLPRYFAPHILATAPGNAMLYIARKRTAWLASFQWFMSIKGNVFRNAGSCAYHLPGSLYLFSPKRYQTIGWRKLLSAIQPLRQKVSR